MPFGLCEKYGITLPENATPRQAWDALKEKTGLSPDSFYEKLDEQNEKINPQDELEKLLGEEFKGYKGGAAVNKLLQEKHGHIKGAFHRDDIGDIDLLWGNDFVGLRHIIKQREAQGIAIIDFMKDLASVIEEGHFRKKTNRGDFEFVKDGKLAVVAIEYHGNKINIY